jgi:Na+(H+)/acetate symporter ActP
MTKSQRKATILGRLVGMAASLYFWFVMNNYSHNVLVHKSVFAAVIEDENMDILAVIVMLIVYTLIITLLAGFISRLLFSFSDD